MSNHYLVAQQDRHWHFSYRGDLTGPFDSKEAAIAEAIRSAEASGLEDIEVVVRDADMRSETVWWPGRAG